MKNIDFNRIRELHHKLSVSDIQEEEFVRESIEAGMPVRVALILPVIEILKNDSRKIN